MTHTQNDTISMNGW